MLEMRGLGLSSSIFALYALCCTGLLSSATHRVALDGGNSALEIGFL